MYAPTKTWRRWHRKINVNQRRYALVSALAASAIPSLVLARGHRIDTVAEVPLVVSSAAVKDILKTKAARALLKAVGASADVEKVKASRKVRRGVGKQRNRRYVSRRGPLVVYSGKDNLTKGFRNVPGVDLCNVDRLNLLQLAPGGHLGRFVIWTESAFAKLDTIYGTLTRPSQKTDYRLPRSIMANPDLPRIINSDEVQSKLTPAKKIHARFHLKKNPLTNLGAMLKLNPYAKTMRRRDAVLQEARKKKTVAALNKKRQLGADKGKKGGVKKSGKPKKAPAAKKAKAPKKASAIRKSHKKFTKLLLA
jgi:large subunit ribosomal protein L4e